MYKIFNEFILNKFGVKKQTFYIFITFENIKFNYYENAEKFLLTIYC